MTVQIAVRLDDDLVAFLDEELRQGRAESRAALVRKALRRLMREESHRHDAEIYATGGSDPDLVSMVNHLTASPPALEDEVG